LGARRIAIGAAATVVAFAASGGAYAATHRVTHHAHTSKAMLMHAMNHAGASGSTANCPNMGPSSSSSSTSAA
jgi:hypothetical protein